MTAEYEKYARLIPLSEEDKASHWFFWGEHQFRRIILNPEDYYGEWKRYTRALFRDQCTTRLETRSALTT